MCESILGVWSRTRPLIYFGAASLGRLGQWSLGVKKSPAKTLDLRAIAIIIVVVTII